MPEHLQIFPKSKTFTKSLYVSHEILDLKRYTIIREYHNLHKHKAAGTTYPSLLTALFCHLNLAQVGKWYESAFPTRIGSEKGDKGNYLLIYPSLMALGTAVKCRHSVTAGSCFTKF